MSGFYAHGATGAVGIQGYAGTSTAPAAWVTLAVQSWDAELSRTKHDTSNTGITAFTSGQPGKYTLKGTLKAQLPLAVGQTAYDQTHNPISIAGPDLQADYCSVVLVGGTTVSGTAVSTVTVGMANTVFSCPACVVTSFKLISANDNIMEYDLSFESSGTVIINSGS